MKRKSWITGIVAAGAAALIVTGAGNHGQTHVSKNLPSGGKPWNGGKPRPPVEVSADLSGTIDADTEVSVTLRVTPGRDCTNLTTRIRGIDGVIVSGGEPVSHAICARDAAVVRPISVRLAAGASGYAIVDVNFEVEGQPMGISQPVPFATSTLTEKTSNPLFGRIGSDSQGTPLVILQAKIH